jgi:ubiquinone/menaquinone biosynthesis C-methylase UbiE
MKVVRRFYQFPIPAIMTEVIDNPFRRRFIQNPGVLADRMHLEPGMTVVEIGPGKGSYTKAVAERVLPGGMVYAVDIQESVVERLRGRLKREGVTNIVPMIDDAYAFSFGDESVDRVFAIACLPEIPDPVRVRRECRRLLKPGGIVSLSELLPDADYPLRGTEKRWAGEAGLEFMEEHGNFFTYQLNFVKK